MDPVATWQRTLSGDATAIAAAERQLEAHLEEAGVPGPVAARAVLLLEEVVLNALRHGGASAVEVEAHARERGCVLVFHDDGAAFDPLSGRSPEKARASIDDVGGRGLLLIRRLAARSAYERIAGRNRLELEIAG